MYQVSNIKYRGEHQSEIPHIIDHGEISIAYDFWAEGGKIEFGIFNHMNVPVMIDFSQSSLIIDGSTFPYFQNRAVTDYSTSGVVMDEGFYAERGHAVTQFDHATVFIAPNSEIIFRKFDPAVPVLRPTATQFSEPMQMVFKDPHHFRHYLCYIVEGETHYVDDHFVVSESYVMNEGDFQQMQQTINQERQMAMFYTLRSEDESSSEALITLLSLLALLAAAAAGAS